MKAKRNPELSRENSEEAPKVKAILFRKMITISKVGMQDGPQVLGSTPPASPPVTGRPTTAARQVETINNHLQAFESGVNFFNCSTGKCKTIVIETKDRSFEVSQATFSSTSSTKSQVCLDLIMFCLWLLNEVLITRERQVAVVEEQTRPSTAKVANVILDNDDGNEDDGEEFLIEEAPKDPLMSLEPDPEVEARNKSMLRKTLTFVKRKGGSSGVRRSRARGARPTDP